MYNLPECVVSGSCVGKDSRICASESVVSAFDSLWYSLDKYLEHCKRKKNNNIYKSKKTVMIEEFAKLFRMTCLFIKFFIYFIIYPFQYLTAIATKVRKKSMRENCLQITNHN